MSFGKASACILILLAAAVLCYAVSVRAGSLGRVGRIVSVLSPAGSSKGKPSPMIQGNRSPATSPADKSSPTVSESPSPIVAPPPANLPPVEGVSFVADRKGFSNGCKQGALTLAPAALRFVCASDPAKSVSASIAQIKGPDDDGIQLISGEKYHFKIEGHDKETMRTLFETWYARASSR